MGKPAPKAHELVTTEFVMDCADDDLVLRSGLEECVDFLTQNPDFAACDGEVLWYDPARDHLFNKWPEKFRGQFQLGHLDFRRPQDFKAFWQCDLSRYRSVVRSEIPKRFFHLLNAHPALQPVNFLDRIFTVIAMSRGRFKTLPTLFMIREEGDRLIHWEEVRKEYRVEIKMKDHLTQERLGPVAELLAPVFDQTPTSTLSLLQETFRAHFSKDNRQCKGCKNEKTYRKHYYLEEKRWEAEAVTRLMQR